MVTKKRKQTIEESKFLGGDIEHTHLVKGLDYALLQKVSGLAGPGLGVWSWVWFKYLFLGKE